MKNTFDINLPSIPGKIIKFKIQDIKASAFSTQQPRFRDNKANLTRKFINSFNNFHETTQSHKEETDTEVETNASTFSKEKRDTDFRYMVGEDKKHLLGKHAQYKNYQAPILKESKFQRGYTFAKVADPEKTYEKELENEPLTENYYFTAAEKLRPEQSQETKTPQKVYVPSAVFKNQTRDRVWSKDAKSSIAPGPGAYIFGKRKENSRTKKAASTEEKKDPNYKELKKIITNIVTENIQEQKEEGYKVEKPLINDHMFIDDDRDRFGDQKFPIAPKLKVPGPGTYLIPGSIQQQSKKVSVLEQQRKLLKQWFNN